MTDGIRGIDRGNASDDDGAAAAGSAAGFAPARFRPPVASDDLLERSDLVARLVEGVREHRLTAVVAPAGYGKTTLVSAVARVLTDEGTVWVSLDESDNDAPRFWAVVGRALSEQVETMPASQDLTEVDAGDRSQRTARSWEMLRELLAVVDGGSDAVVVLDDLHRITEETILEQLRFLVEHAPSSLRVVVASRRIPALPLARLRAQGRFFELGVPELRFTWEETVALFESRGVEAPTGELRRIHERTRGWPAGLHLASSALQLAGSASARTDRARSLARSEQHMRDVLADEVLASLDDDDREFLLDVALVDRLNPTDARALTGREDAGSVLDRLYRSGVALLSRTEPSSPGEEPVYQHHPLFSTLLRQRLRNHDQDRYTALHRRAAEREGDPALRLAHLVEAGADAEVVGELDDHGQTLLARGLARQVLTALESLPDDLVDQHPGLTMLAGRARWQTGDYVDAGVALRRAAATFGDDAEPAQRSVALVGAADCALLVGNVEQADRDIRNALGGELPPEALASAYAARLRVVQFAGSEDIGGAAEDAVRTALEHPEPRVLRDAARSLWMGVGVAADGLDLLERFCDVAWPVIADEDDFARACLCGLSATVALYRGAPGAAADLASSALELWDRLGVAPPVHAQSARVLLVLALIATGDHAGLDRWLPELRRGAQQIALPPSRSVPGCSRLGSAGSATTSQVSVGSPGDCRRSTGWRLPSTTSPGRCAPSSKAIRIWPSTCSHPSSNWSSASTDATCSVHPASSWPAFTPTRATPRPPWRWDCPRSTAVRGTAVRAGSSSRGPERCRCCGSQSTPACT